MRNKQSVMTEQRRTNKTETGADNQRPRGSTDEANHFDTHNTTGNPTNHQMGTAKEQQGKVKVRQHEGHHKGTYTNNTLVKPLYVQ